MISLEQLVRYIFRKQTKSIYEENMMKYMGLEKCLVNRISDSRLSNYIIPVPEKKDVSLKEAIEDSVQNVLKEKGNRKIYILWSGGIDSTLVLTALLRHNINVTIVCDEHSTKEYPFLWNKIKNKELNCDYIVCEEACDGIFKLSKNKDVLFITGEIGDQLTGSMVTMRYTYEQRNMLMKDVIDKDLFSKPYLYPELMNKYNPIKIEGYNNTELAIQYCEEDIYKFLGTNRDTTTLSEFLWALNFIYKYMLVILRLYPCGLWYEGKDKNTIHFFNTEKFQQWSMTNYKENCAYIKDSDYKMPFKDYIFEFTKDKEYHDNKIKEPSLNFSFYYAPNGDIRR